MQITASTLQLSSQTLSYHSQEQRQRLEMWVGERPPPEPRTPERPRPAVADPRPSADAGLYRTLERAAKAKSAEAEPEPQLDPESERILLILEKLFGMKGARSLVLQTKAVQTSLTQSSATAQVQPAQSQAQQPAGWGMIYEESTRTVSYQSASLVAEGSLTLADGSSLAFTLDWKQTSLRIEESSSRLALGDARLTDPLIFDLDGNGLAFNGTMPLTLAGPGPALVARPADADALLVHDGNGNGLVEAGEVVGASSGNAFQDISAFDSDGNGWIDKNDAVWVELRLLDGAGKMHPLDGSIAALATRSVALPYQHLDDDGGLQAVGRRGGVAIAADGTARAVAQVDLVV